MPDPIEYDVPLTQGDDFVFGFLYKVGKPPVLVNVTGYTATMKWKRRDGTTVAEFDSEGGTDGTITVGTTNGRFDCFLAAAHTVDLPAEDLVYDLHIVPPTPAHVGVGEWTPLSGLVKVRQRRAP